MFESNLIQFVIIKDGKKNLVFKIELKICVIPKQKKSI